MANVGRMIAMYGKCHICQKLDMLKLFKCRSVCMEHWVCGECERQCGECVYDLINDAHLDCCGPVSRVA